MEKGTMCLIVSVCINSSKRHHLQLVWLALTQFLGLRALELFLSPVSVVVTGWSCGNCGNIWKGQPSLLTDDQWLVPDFQSVPSGVTPLRGPATLDVVVNYTATFSWEPG